jgi:hypothetical protein
MEITCYDPGIGLAWWLVKHHARRSLLAICLRLNGTKNQTNIAKPYVPVSASRLTVAFQAHNLKATTSS